MTRRAWLALLTGLLLAAGAFLLAGASLPHRARRSGRPPALAPLAPTRTTPLRTVSRAARSPVVATVGPQSDPAHVARAFVLGWLACTYHRRPCASIPGTLHAYKEALGRQHAQSLPTPEERLAHPRVLMLHLVRACRRSATATATYQNGEAGRFQLHLNLIDDGAAWKVFDVAESSPHIALPMALNHRPGRC